MVGATSITVRLLYKSHNPPTSSRGKGGVAQEERIKSGTPMATLRLPAGRPRPQKRQAVEIPLTKKQRLAESIQKLREEKRLALLAQFQSTYPVFSKPHLPLAIGTGKALKRLCPVGTRHTVGRVLHVWCLSEAYLTALKAPDSMRHDLNGNPVEPVSEEHRLEASTRRSLA